MSVLAEMHRTGMTKVMIDGIPLFLYKNKVDGVVKSRSSLAKFAGSRVKPPRGFLSATNLIDRGVA